MRTKSLLNQSGIYKIVNTINQKMYIGSAFNIRKRWKAHRNRLRKNKHANRHLQAAFNKYGDNVFSWEILEFIPKNQDLKQLSRALIKREQDWITHLNTHNREKGYNLSPTAGTMLGVKHTEESRKHMSEAHLGNKQSPETRRKISISQYKPVYQISVSTGKVVNKFQSVIDASKATGLHKQGISMCCRNVIKKTGGFHWTYDLSSFIKPSLKRKTISRPWMHKPVSNGKTQWDTVTAACKEQNLSWEQFHKKCIRGEFFYV
jgi:hypothetical protein